MRRSTGVGATLGTHTEAKSARGATAYAGGNAAFRAVFEPSSEPLLLVDSEFQIHNANRRTKEMLHLRDGAASNLNDHLDEPIQARLANWTAEANEFPIASAVLRSGFAIRLQLRAELPEAKLFLLAIEEGSLVERAESKWRLAEAEMQSILDSVRVGILLLDASGKVRRTNARFGQLFGLDASNLKAIETAEDVKTFIAPRFEDARAFLGPWQNFAAGDGDPSHDELEIARPARRVLERFSRPVLDSQNRKVGWVEVYYDVTGDRQLQSKLLQTEKMAALGHLISGIAHELNNPLTAITGYAQLLLSHRAKQDQRAEAQRVFDEAERASRIVKNLLYFARENKPERTRTDLNEIVERALALRSYELRVENIAVELALAEDLPLTMADPHQLQQAVLNLITNAEQALVQFRGAGRIWIRTRNIAGKRIAIEVSDDGPGVAKEIAARIFEPFFTTKPPGVGTGLGLSIVYGIAQNHGGEITLESRPTGGATFILELPITIAEAQAPLQNASTMGAARAAAEKSPRAVASRVLVVEDEPTIAQLVVDVLREDGHRIDAVLDSQEGLARISRGHYDLVICDLRMPRLDGPAFYDALVRSGSPLAEHIVFITGDTLAPRTAKFLESTNLPYLAKPFLVEELRLLVNRHLSAAHAASENTNLSAHTPLDARSTKQRTTNRRD
jgi:signal transduction histidine kinase/FixJ family two-component response regulator